VTSFDDFYPAKGSFQKALQEERGSDRSIDRSERARRNAASMRVKTEERKEKSRVRPATRCRTWAICKNTHKRWWNQEEPNAKMLSIYLSIYLCISLKTRGKGSEEFERNLWPLSKAKLFSHGGERSDPIRSDHTTARIQ
jgi:hypothetical protein